MGRRSIAGERAFTFTFGRKLELAGNQSEPIWLPPELRNPGGGKAVHGTVVPLIALLPVLLSF